MRAAAEYVRDVVIVLVIIMLMAGYLAGYWLCIGIIYLVCAVLSYTIYRKPPDDPPAHKRRDT